MQNPNFVSASTLLRIGLVLGLSFAMTACDFSMLVVDRVGPATESSNGPPTPPPVCKISSLQLMDSAGGWTGGGILGQYYGNITNPTDWLGNMSNYTPTFSRTDVRIDFTNDSMALMTGPGGVPQDINYSAVGSTNFAVKWSGSFIPKFSQTYTFMAVTKGGVNLKINGKTVINNFASHPVSRNTYSIALSAGTVYTLEMDYYQDNSVGWNAQLHWFSAVLNPTDVCLADQAIEPATPVGINYQPDAKIFADVARFASFPSAPAPAISSTDGWPTQDFNVTLFYNSELAQEADKGTYILQFKGKAQVSHGYGPNLTFKVGSTTYTNTLPVGAGFDGTTTTAILNVPSGLGYFGYMTVAFTQTQRNSGGGGITDLHLMRPTALNGTTSFPVGSLLTFTGTSEFAPFTTFRMMDWTDTNNNTETNWSDRIPASANFWVPPGNRGLPWEAAIAVANGAGKDLYINIPTYATDAYVTNLAKVIKYGSDGVNPYTSPQSNPVWAPLNPNLNLYIEYANEVWNWGSPVYKFVGTAVGNAQQINSSDWQLFSSAGGWYTASNNNSDTSLWTLVRDIAISNDFRQVFGDNAMPGNNQGINAQPRIRPIFEWQYGGSWNGGSDASDIAMENVGAKLPYPINHYIWGGGGGWYTDYTNGGFRDVQFENPNFDSGAAGWTFSNGANLEVDGSPVTHPNAPTAVAPGSPSKSTTNVVYLPPGASVSQSVSFSGGYADITLYATQTAAVNWVNGLSITVDGGSTLPQSEGPYLYSGSQNAWGWSRTGAFYTGASPGNHTITFTNTWPASSGVNVFLTNLGIQTVNGLYAEEPDVFSSLITSVNADTDICLQFGLHDVGYEGGADFSQNLGFGYSSMGNAGYSSVIPNVAMYANLDPRFTSIAIQTLNQFFQDGGSLPIIYQSVGNVNSWGVIAPDLNTALGQINLIPKVEAVIDVGQSLPPASTNGKAMGTVNVPSYDPQSVGKRTTQVFLVSTAGTYQAGATFSPISNGSAGTFQVLVDGNVEGSFTVTNGLDGGPYTVPVSLSAGSHSVQILCTVSVHSLTMTSVVLK